MSQQLIEIAPRLFVGESYWSVNECEAVINELVKADGWQDAAILNTYTVGEVCKDIRRQKVLKSVCIEQKIKFSQDMAKYGYLLGVTEELTPHLLEYQTTEAGGFFGWHPDYYEGSERALSSLLYLNDGLIGGNTEFVIGDEIIEIEPKAGNFVLFDPKIIHRGAEVVSGIKYTLLVIHQTNCGCKKYRQLNRNSDSIVRELDSQNG